jgi:hypothetical protein
MSLCLCLCLCLCLSLSLSLSLSSAGFEWHSYFVIDRDSTHIEATTHKQHKHRTPSQASHGYSHQTVFFRDRSVILFVVCAACAWCDCVCCGCVSVSVCSVRSGPVRVVGV